VGGRMVAAAVGVILGLLALWACCQREGQDDRDGGEDEGEQHGMLAEGDNDGGRRQYGSTLA